MSWFVQCRWVYAVNRIRTKTEVIEFFFLWKIKKKLVLKSNRKRSQTEFFCRWIKIVRASSGAVCWFTIKLSIFEWKPKISRECVFMWLFPWPFFRDKPPFELSLLPKSPNSVWESLHVISLNDFDDFFFQVRTVLLPSL